MLFAEIGDVKIDEVDFDGGDLTNIEFKLEEPTLDTFKFNLRSDTNVVEIQTDDLGIHVTADFKYKKGLIHTHGRTEIKVDKVNLDLQLMMG